MKFRTAVLTSAAVMLASSAAMAHHTNKDMNNDMMDITSPFYLPMEGKMLSETSVEYSRLNGEKFGNLSEGWYAKEILSYGVSDNMSVFAAIGNTFDNKEGPASEGAYNNSHNYDYTVGMKYNHHFDKVMTQMSVAYNTFQPKSFGYEGSDNWNKYVNLGAKVGYQMDSGCMPYVSFNANYGLNTVDHAYLNMMSSPVEDHFTYVSYAGVYKAYDKVSTDMGIRWDNVRQGLGDGKSRDDVYAQATINYKIADDMSVGVYGDYLVGDSHMSEFDYVYTVGANLKVAF